MALEIYPPSIRCLAFCLDSFYIELHTIDNLNPLSRLSMASNLQGACTYRNRHSVSWQWVLIFSAEKSPLAFGRR